MAVAAISALSVTSLGFVSLLLVGVVAPFALVFLKGCG